MSDQRVDAQSPPERPARGTAIPSLALEVLEALARLVAEHLAGRTNSPLPPPATPNRAWLSVEELARLLGRHPDTVRDDLRAGRLPGVKVGRSWRTPVADLEAFLKGVRQTRTQDQARVADARAWLRAERTRQARK